MDNNLHNERADALAAEPFEPRELYPLISKTAAEAGWADPQKDDYDRYDEEAQSRLRHCGGTRYRDGLDLKLGSARKASSMAASSKNVGANA